MGTLNLANTNVEVSPDPTQPTFAASISIERPFLLPVFPVFVPHREPSDHPPTANMPSADFEAAVKASKQLKAKPGNDELLDLYALYKIANGEDISKAAAPGMFDLKGKA